MAYPLSHLHSSQLSVNNGCREKRKKERKRGWKRTDRIKDRRVKRKKSQRTDVTRWIGWGDVEHYEVYISGVLWGTMKCIFLGDCRAL